MTITSLSYAPPVRRRLRAPRVDYELLETAEQLAEQGQAVESIGKVLAHLFPLAAVPDLTQEPLTIVQGSSRVSLRIDGEHLVISVPVARLPDGGRAVAALRYVLTKISGSGQLHQPRLRGDELHLEFSDRLTRMHPAKLLEVLRRMPIEADRSDDWLADQFGATALDRAPIAALSADEIERCEALWRQHWADIEELVKEAQRKQSVFFLNEVTAFAIHRVALMFPLAGVLDARLQESAITFDNTQEQPLHREAALAKFAKEMRAIPSEELQKNLGHASYAISPLREGTEAMLTGYFDGGDYIETIDKLRGSGRSMEAALALMSTYTFLLARFSWPEPVEAELMGGLALASDRPWREAASLLFDHSQALIAKFGEPDEEPDDGDEADAREGEACEGEV